MDKLKERLKQADWWEITYLIIYGGVFTFEFLNTTMFEVKWPPKFAYIFLASTALYVMAKIIWHNTYTKKEMIWAGIILFAFLMPALLTEYRFLWYTGFLIVGAKDIDFDKILKVYLVIGITIMVAAFGASQMGWIENLQYEALRGENLIIRNSFGSVYPTDFAAHIFYLVIASVCISEPIKTGSKLFITSLLAVFVLNWCGARTSSICMMALVIAIIVYQSLKKIIEKEKILYILNAFPFTLAGMFLGLVHFFDYEKEWMVKIDSFLSNRLIISKVAINSYEYKLFGQYIRESGLGRLEGIRQDYFFLDNSYIRIALLYGVILFLVVMMLFWKQGLRAIQEKRIILIIAIAIIAMHSFMEHHLIEIAYNPLLCFLFTKKDVIVDKG